MRKELLLLLLVALFAQSIQAQIVQRTLPTRPSQKAQLTNQANYNMQPYNGAAFVNQQLAQQNPFFANELQSYLQAIPSLSQMNMSNNNDDDNNGADFSPPVYTIPVVVHVVHDPSASVGTDANLSISQIQSQIDRLNEAFRLQNTNIANTPLAFQALAADAEIEFCLANVGPNGQASNGILRHPVSTNSIVDINYIEQVIKPSTSWNPALYLNIWIVAVPGTTDFGGIKSYAYYPTTSVVGVNPVDGVVVDYRFFGNTGNALGEGVACIREVGRYLGLPDVWGGFTPQGFPIGCTSDDGLTDTPNQEFPTSLSESGCPTVIPTSCGSNDMYSNYMDYLKDESCQSMFTVQQITVMRAVLSGLAATYGYGDRSSLTTSSASACTQPCTITLNTTTTPESCGNLADGSASITAAGGTPPYLYSWSTGQNTSSVSGLSAGTYQVTVTDFSACAQIADITIDGASTITGTITTTNATCASNDGSATIAPTGGNAPYSVSWATNPPQIGNTATNLSEGIYPVVVVDANNCTYTDFAIIRDFCVDDCDTVLNANLLTTIPALYLNPYSGGFISGVNGFDDQAKAEYFDYQGVHTHVVGVSTVWAVASTNDPTATVEIVVWDGTGGQPGAELGSQTYNIQTLAANLAQGFGSYIPFDQDNYVPVGTEFFVGFKIPDLTTGDTMALATNTIGDGSALNGNSSWEQWSDGTWHSFQSSWGIDSITLGVAPQMGTPPQAAFNSTNITACDSQTVSFSNLSVNGSSFTWNLQGADTISPVMSSPSVTYYTPGTYDATLMAFNGCLVDTLAAPSAVTINACPTTCDLYATLTSTRVTCNGGSNGSATVTPNAGIAPYNIVWSTGATTNLINGLSAGTYNVTITDATGCSVVGTVTVAAPTGLVLTTSSTDETCATNDGSVSVSVTGGTMPYAYSWNTPTTPTANTIAGLADGTYIVTVTDANGCTAVASTTVNDICPGCNLSLADSSTSPVCFGDANGSIAIIPTGGTYPYTYTWTVPSTDSSLTGLTAGVYGVTVTDAFNCQDSTSVTISQPDQLQLVFSTVPEDCADSNGVASAFATGGTAPYLIAWNTTPITIGNQLSNLSAGTYAAGVLDANNCIFIDSVVVADICPCGDTITISSTAETCTGNDGTATVSAVGGQFTYLWSNGDTAATITGLPFGSYSVTVTDTSGCASVATVIVDDGCNCGMTLTTTSTGESCLIGGDGSAMVMVSGFGQAPYSYQWSTTPVQTNQTAVGLSQGNYTVTVTDASGCSETATVTVDGIVAVSITSNNASCNLDNGTATAIATGGDGNYSYLWNLGGSASADVTVSNLAAGTYSVTVTDGDGCTADAAVTIVQNGTFSVSMNGVDNFCSTNGASVSALAVGGGTAPYTFNWGPPLTGVTASSANNLTTGVYTVTVSDANGCLATNSVTVTSINAGPTLAVNQMNTSCFGVADGSIDLTVNANTAVAINWSNGVNSEDLSNLAAGNYTVIVVDANGCIASTTVVIAEPNPIVITGTSTPTTGNDGTASAGVSGGTPPYTYSWNNGDNTQTITGLLPGNYIVTVTDANGCTGTGTIEVQEFTNTTQLSTLSRFELYPNPNTGLFNIDVAFTQDEEVTVSVLNAVGQQIWSEQMNATQFLMPMDLSQVASGIYFVSIQTKEGRAIKRVVIAR